MKDKYLQNKDTELCGSDILNGYMSSRIIRSKFLMDEDATSSEKIDLKQTTENDDTDVIPGTVKINLLENGSDKITAYPAPPPIKKIEQPKLVINIEMKRQRAQKKDNNISMNSPFGQQSKNQTAIDYYQTTIDYCEPIVMGKGSFSLYQSSNI